MCPQLIQVVYSVVAKITVFLRRGSKCEVKEKKVCRKGKRIKERE